MPFISLFAKIESPKPIDELTLDELCAEYVLCGDRLRDLKPGLAGAPSDELTLEIDRLEARRYALSVALKQASHREARSVFQEPPLTTRPRW